MDAMMTFLGELNAWTILKWVILVLIAGFIGQFGKTLAQAIMKRSRGKGKEQDLNGSVPLSPETPKRTSPDGIANDTSVVVPAGNGIPDKKAMKTLAKQQKKADKLTKKT
jgi:hypothetical protein